LEDGEDRQPAGLRLDAAAERVERALLALRRREIGRRPARRRALDRQQVGDQRGVLRRRPEIAQHAVELVEPDAGIVAAFEPGGPLDLADHRLERAVAVMRQAEIAQPPVRLALDAFHQRARQSRLADAGLAGEQHHPAGALLDLLPMAQQEAELLLAAEQGAEVPAAQRVETAGRLALAQDLPDRYCLAEALECPCAEIAILEQP